MQSSRQLFTPEEVERARRYHRPLYIAVLVDTTLGLVTLVAARLRAPRIVAVRPCRRASWWGRALLFPIVVLGVLTLLRLPLSFWRGYVRECRWGFSPQTAQGWWLDRAKGFAVAAGLGSLATGSHADNQTESGERRPRFAGGVG
jgi:STE24 endopeptidase